MLSREVNGKSQKLFSFIQMAGKRESIFLNRALAKREYLMILFLISHRKHML